MSIKLETGNPVRCFQGLGTEVVVSRSTPTAREPSCVPAKLDRIRALGAGLVLVDGDHEVAREQAASIARHDGIRLVEDSLDIETCEGAATIHRHAC